MAVVGIMPAIVELPVDFFTFYNIAPGPVLGSGMSGEVVLITSPTDWSLKIAVKKLSLLTDDGGIKNMKLFATETGFLQGLSHPNVIKHMLSASCPEYLVICTEYCPNGTLTSRLGNLSPEMCAAYFLQMACAVRYLNARQGILHGDIKPGNIFINANNEAVLGDFGLSVFIPPNGTLIPTDVLGGTPGFLAPERITCSHVDPFKVDVYSLGIVLWCMVFMREPDSIHFQPTAMGLPIILNVPQTLLDCLMFMTVFDPTIRPTAVDLLNNLHSIGFNRDLIDML